MRSELLALFRDVADLPPREREEYFARQAVPEPLRAEVESLLRYDLSSDSFQDCIDGAGRLLHAPDGSAARPARFQPEDRIGRFIVTRLLGRGGMGEVYLARDPVIARPVAIKLIGNEFDDDGARRRLAREARAAGTLRHPNLVTVYDAGEHNGRSYIAMEYVPGETLGSIIRRRAELSLARKLEMIEGVCAGLAHAHRAGIVHLDIKPDNLMVDETGLVKVLDFGISRRLHGDTAATANLAGTLRYMSPEQVQGRPLNQHSDVYSLGCVLFELLSYAAAYGGSTTDIVMRISQGPVPRLRDTSAALDARLDPIVARAMALDPTARYDDLDELRAELAAIRAEIGAGADEREPLRISTTAAGAPALSRRAAGPASRWQRALAARWIAAVAAAVVAIAAATAVLLPTDVASPAPSVPSPVPEAAGSRASAPANRASDIEASPAAPDLELSQRSREDREPVLEAIERTGEAALAGSAPVARSVIDTTRAAVVQRRTTAAAAAGGAAHDAFQAAEQQLALANDLAAAGKEVESLRALWLADELYSRALATSGPTRTIAVVDTSDKTLESGPAATSDREVTPLAATPQSAPAESTLLPPPTLEPERAAERPPGTAPGAANDDTVIRDTLGRYDAAFRALDLPALVRVFPSLNPEQVEQLRRTFDGLTTYQMETRPLRLNVTGDTATVEATVQRRMVPRVGLPVSSQNETLFRLTRVNGVWQIVGVAER